MKRQRSRNRGGGGGNSGKPQHNANRAFESNGPDGVKIRGAAQHVFEKYQQLARDALTSGDRVLAESYQQHAEHYFRVLRAVQPQRLVGEIMNRDAFASGYDIDFEDESGEAEAQAEAPEAEAERPADRGEWRQENRQESRPENRYERPRDDQRPRDDRPRDRNNNNNNGDRNNGYRDDRGDRSQQDRARDDRPRDDRPRDDRPQENRARDDRPREDRYRDDRPRDDRPQGARDDRPRDDRPRDDRPRNYDRNDRYRDDRRPERGNERNNERNGDPLPVVEPQATPLVSEVDQPGSPILRSQDGGVSQAPAFLQARSITPAPEADNDGEARPKARRKRAPREIDGDSPTPAGDVTEDA
ncbi:MAG TPA: DUF4167 domain-containing protein [Caulobacteraceae bacterium]|jgi:hypothetical protein